MGAFVVLRLPPVALVIITQISLIFRLIAMATALSAGCGCWWLLFAVDSLCLFVMFCCCLLMAQDSEKRRKNFLVRANSQSKNTRYYHCRSVLNYENIDLQYSPSSFSVKGHQVPEESRVCNV